MPVGFQVTTRFRLVFNLRMQCAKVTRLDPGFDGSTCGMMAEFFAEDHPLRYSI